MFESGFVNYSPEFFHKKPKYRQQGCLLAFTDSRSPGSQQHLSKVQGLRLFNLEHLIKTLGLSHFRRLFPVTLYVWLLLNWNLCTLFSRLTNHFWQGLVYHWNYVTSEGVLLSHGTFKDLNMSLVCTGKDVKALMRSQSQPPGFDIWDVQGFLRGKIYVVVLS